MAIDTLLLERITNNDPELIHLDLSYHALTDTDIEALTEALAENTYLFSLDVTGNPLNLACIERIAAITTLHTLNLSGCKITADMAPLLASMSNLHTLKLNYNQLGAEGAAAFIENTTLTHLELIDNQLSDAGTLNLAKNRHLQYVNVASNDISNEGAIALSEHPVLTSLLLMSNQVGAFGAAALSRNTRLVVLHLDHNRVGTEGAYALGTSANLQELTVGYNEITQQGLTALAKNTVLRTLSVAGNSITEDDVDVFAQNQSLTSLDVCFNQINDVGTKKFEQNHTLTHLNVSNNYVSPEGAAYLAAHKTLKSLDISYNAIEDEGGIVLSKNPRLTFLNVTGCELTSKSAVAFADNTTLSTLHLDFNEVDNVGAIALAQNTTLRHLSLGNNLIEDEGGQAFAEATTLETLSLSYNRLGETSVRELQHNTAFHTLKITLEPPLNFFSDTQKQLFLKRLFLMSQEFLCILNQDGIIQFFNPTFSRLLGYKADVLLAKPAMDFVHPDDRALKPVYVNEKVPAFTLKNRYLCNDGSFRCVQWRCHVEEDKTYAVGRDVTELRSAENKLYEQEEQGQLAKVRRQQDELFLQKQTDFIAHLCHEIRNPLSGVIGYLDILMDHFSVLETHLMQPHLSRSDSIAYQPKDDIDNIKLILLDIEECTEHQKVILDNNLDATMLDGRQLSLNTTAFDPKEAILSAVKILQGRALPKQIKITVSLPAEDMLLQGDDFRFKQIALNLLGNAVKFTEKGRIHIMLTVLEQNARKTQLELKVKDTGIGMIPEEVDKLFQRFTQANLSVGAQYGGSGLGLFITKKLVELMSGDIQVKSTLGKGTTFSCTLQLETVVKQLQLEPVSTSYVRLFSPVSYQVLVVDDNVINQKVLKTMVERAGHTCYIANDGHEAITAYQRLSPTIIFMDILMPRMNGIEATLAIRRLEALHSQDRPTPIIALSGNAQAHDKEEALKAGMTDYITKPFKRDQIYQTINRYRPAEPVVQEIVEPHRRMHTL